MLPGVTPGIHPAYAHYMIRRIRVASNSPLVELCRTHGYTVEAQRKFDGSVDHSTMVVEFPFSYPNNAVTAAEMTAVKQLDVVARLQREWSDNAVSCTVYFKKEELPEIQAYLAEHWNDNFKSLSFLLHSGHGFDQAPFEEITKKAYDEMISKSTLITGMDQEEVVFDSDDECATGICPIK